MGLTPAEFWDLTWPEYEYAVTAYRTRLSRQWEPIRELYALYYNTHVDKADQKQPHELIPLYTDRQEAAQAAAAPTETPQDFYRRMVANNFFMKEKQKDTPTS